LASNLNTPLITASRRFAVACIMANSGGSQSGAFSISDGRFAAMEEPLCGYLPNSSFNEISDFCAGSRHRYSDEHANWSAHEF
jgi:hypothetical protein